MKPVVALSTIGVVALSLALPAIARADDPCADAFAEAPVLAHDGKLQAAKARLLTCASPTCPREMQPICADDLLRIQARTPSVVFAASDAHHRDLSDVRVVEDGHVLAARLDGRSIEIDPGPHTFVFDDGVTTETMRVVVSEGEHARSVRVTLRGPVHYPPPSVVRRPIPWWVVATGALTLGAGAAWAAFGVLGVREYGEAQTCWGHCSNDLLERQRLHVVLADVFMGVTLTGLVGTTILFLVRPSVSD